MSILNRRSAVVDPCLGQCKDTHVYDMHTVLGAEAGEGSSEFIRPLHTVLLTSTGEREVAGKLDAICKHNKAHHQCLATCSDTPGTRALIIGLRPWSFICKNWKFGELKSNIPCMLKHAAVLDRACVLQLENLKGIFNSIWDSSENVGKQLGPLCRAAKSYDLCYGDAVGYYCGQKAVSFWQALSDISNATILELLSMSDQFDIPEQCKNRWYDASLPPPMTKSGGVKASAQRQVSSRSRGSDLTVEKFWGKTNGVGGKMNAYVTILILMTIDIVKQCTTMFV